MEKEGKKYTIIEGNLLEYPIFSMERRRVNRVREEYTWREKNIAGQIVTERRFTVNCTYGIPNAFDLDIFNAIMRLYYKQWGRYKKNEAHFTIYEIAKELGIQIGGSKIKRIKESLIRMSHTALMFEHTFYLEKERVTKKVDLIVKIEYYEKQKGKKRINAVKIVLDDELISSIERNYFKLIDFNIYKSLSPGLPRRLYEYLEKKKYRKDRFEINIIGLARRIPLKTRKISQLKEMIEEANNVLKNKGVISNWKFQRNNVVYYFKKSERLREVEKDLFHLERLVNIFYQSLGQTKISKGWLNEGVAVLKDLIDEGYNNDEIEYCLGWAADNIKDIHSIRIIPKVIGQALGDKESKRLVEEREKKEQQKRMEEDRKREEERKRGEELDKIFESLPEKKQTKLEEKAKENLIEQGVNPNFMLPTMVRLERNKLLEKKKSLVKKGAGGGGK